MSKVGYYLLLFMFALAGYLVKKYLFPTVRYLTNDLDPETLDGLKKWAAMFVRAAKNMVTELTTGAKRRDWVMEQLTNICAGIGLDLTDEQKRALLEAAYDEMNAQDAAVQTAELNESRGDSL